MAARVAGFFDGGAARHADVDAEFVGDDMRQGGFAESGRAVEQHVVESFSHGF